VRRWGIRAILRANMPKRGGRKAMIYLLGVLVFVGSFMVGLGLAVTLWPKRMNETQKRLAMMIAQISETQETFDELYREYTRRKRQ
jgi:hypothetical protein